MIRYRLTLTYEAGDEEYLCVEEPYTSGDFAYIRTGDCIIMRSLTGVTKLVISHIDKDIKPEAPKKRKLGFPTSNAN